MGKVGAKTMPLSSPFPLLDIRKASEMKEEDRGRWWFGFSGREIKKNRAVSDRVKGKELRKNRKDPRNGRRRRGNSFSPVTSCEIKCPACLPPLQYYTYKQVDSDMPPQSRSRSKRKKRYFRRGFFLPFSVL